jgi:hypothetical protein
MHREENCWLKYTSFGGASVQIVATVAIKSREYERTLRTLRYRLGAVISVSTFRHLKDEFLRIIADGAGSAPMETGTQNGLSDCGNAFSFNFRMGRHSRYRPSESWWRPAACIKDDNEIPSKRTPFLVGRSGSSKPRLRLSRSATLSMASPDLLRVIC